MMGSVCVSVAGVCAESVTMTMKSAVPAGPVGVPVMHAARLIRRIPAGNAPVLTVNVLAPVPPVDVTVWL